MSPKVVTDPDSESCVSARESAEALVCSKAAFLPPSTDDSQHLTLILSHDHTHLLFPSLSVLILNRLLPHTFPFTTPQQTNLTGLELR